MKNKKLIYILLPAVLAIWGTIFYRIFNAAGGDEATLALNEFNSNSGKESSYRDTFSIAADYRDPFMGKIAVVKDVRSNTAVTQPRQAEPKPQPVKAQWPALSYSGMIRNQKSSVQLAMLQVNGQSFTLKTGATAEGVQIVRIYKDSLEVSFQKEKRIIRK